MSDEPLITGLLQYIEADAVRRSLFHYGPDAILLEPTDHAAGDTSWYNYIARSIKLYIHLSSLLSCSRVLWPGSSPCFLHAILL